MDAHALTTRMASARSNPAMLVAAALPPTGLVVGAALAANTRAGVAVLLALVFVPVVLTNLQLGLALWFPVIFLEGLPAFNAAGKAGGLLIAGAWLAATRRLARPPPEAARRLRPLALVLAALLVFYTLSLTWAADAGLAASDLWHWWAVGLLAIVVATTINSRRRLRIMCAAFLAGAVLTVAFGIAGGQLTTATSAVQTASEGRLGGGQGDPNFLAAGLVPAMILGMVLFATTDRRWVRLVVAASVAVVALGLVASESRGGAIAAVVATVAAFALFRRHRAQLLVFATLIGGIAATWFSLSPHAWQRVSTFDNGGSGRHDLWTLAWSMFENHPLHGVGLVNFSARAPDYARGSGSLNRLDLIFEHHAQVVHNAYLQALADTGAIGLCLFLAIAALSMRAAWLAAGRFRAVGDLAMEMLARALIVATIGLLASSLFISNGVDKRLWVLFALGPAALTVAYARRDGRAAAG